MARCTALMLAMALVLASAANSAHSQTGLEVFAAGQTVNSIIDRLKGSANEVIHNAGTEFGNGAFATRQNAEILIQQLNAMMIEFEGKTFRDLDAAQQRFFVNTRNTLEQMKRATKYSVAQAEGLVAQADNMLGTLPGANKTARVTGFSPRYVVASAKSAPITVTVNGSWLGSGEPTLSLNRRACERLQKTEPKLIFSCLMPSVSGKQVAYQKLHLTTVDRPSFWERVLSWFGSEPDKRPYELAIAVVPQTLGSFSAEVRTKAAKIEEAPRTETVYSANEHCQGTRTYAWTINAREGWRIKDRPTTQLLGDSDAVDEGVQDWSPTGFRLRGQAKNNGQCIDLVLEKVRDGRGHVRIQANWIEFRSVDDEANAPLQIGDIFWGKERSIRLPDSTTFVAIQSELLNGQRCAGSSLDQADCAWYGLSIDVPNRLLIIRPKDVDEALAAN